MVEGIVVMTTMLVFLGMNVWAENVYGGKLDQASATRRDVLYYASHGCEGGAAADVDTYTQASLGGAGAGLPGTDTGNAPDLGGQPQQVGQALEGRDPSLGVGSAVSRSWNTAEVAKAGSVVGSTLVGDNSILVQKRILSQQLNTTSWTICNEKSYASGWKSLLDFGWEFLRTAGGVPG